jgi:hypothetical protein
MRGKLIRITGIYTLLVEDDKMIASDDVDMQKDYQIGKLSKENCDEIFGVIDVDKLAEDDWDIYGEQFKNTPIWDYKEIFVAGFNKAMELYQPTEIEVEIEYHTIKQTKVYGAIKGVKGSGHKITTTGYAPKLDENNNLILRRI